MISIGGQRMDIIETLCEREEQRDTKVQLEPIPYVIHPKIFPANFDNTVPRWMHCRAYCISLPWQVLPIMKPKGLIAAPYAT